jgi:hypothetical protein
MDDLASDKTGNDIITIKKLLGHKSDAISLKIAISIENEIRPFFIKEVVQNVESDVIVVERKGLNLFRPYLSDIQGFRNILSIKPFEYQHPHFFRYSSISLIKEKNRNILLTDAITTGTEVRKILRGSIFKSSRYGGFRKVCGYLAMKKALDELSEEFPDIEFKFLRIADNSEEYNEEHKKLTYVYQNRMEPIDEEHPYTLFKIKKDIDIGALEEQIFELMKKRFGQDIILVNDELGISNKYNFTIHFEDPEKILQQFLNYQLNRSDKLEKLAARFRFSSNDSRLRIMTVSMPNLKKETLIEGIRRLLLCSCQRNLHKRICKINSRNRFYLNRYRGVICSNCVDKNISSNLLREIYLLIDNSDLVEKDIERSIMPQSSF